MAKKPCSDKLEHQYEINTKQQIGTTSIQSNGNANAVRCIGYVAILFDDAVVMVQSFCIPAILCYLSVYLI